MAASGGASPDKKKGRKQRRDSHKGQIRRPNLNRYYRKKLRDLHLNGFEFRVDLVRPEVRGRARRLTIDSAVTGFGWEYSGDALTGSLSMSRRRPDKPLPIGENHQIILLVRWRGKWVQIWRMNVDGTPGVSLVSGEVTASLADEFEGMRRNLRDREYKKSKGDHPKGWKCHEVAKDVCKREGVKIGRLAKGTEYLEKIKEDQSSGIDIIKKAYKMESDKTGRKYVFRFINGKLFVTELRRNRIIYEVDGGAEDINLEGKAKDKHPVTVIEAKGRIKKDGKDEKIEATIFRRRVLRRYGRSTKEKSYGRVKSHKDLRDQAMKELADEIRIERTASFTIPGIPFLMNGDTIFWRNKEPGWHGKAKDIQDRRYAYITSISHTVGAGTYTTDFEVKQEDPYLADRRRLAEKRRDEKNGNSDDDNGDDSDSDNNDRGNDDQN